MAARCARRRIQTQRTAAIATTTMSILTAVASPAGPGGHHSYFASVDPRSIIQCQAVCAASADAMMMPTRSRHDEPEHQPEERRQQRDHQQLPELDADIEGEERRDDVRAGKLQRLTQRERETEPVHKAEPEGDGPSSRHARPGGVRSGRAATTMFSSAM